MAKQLSHTTSGVNEPTDPGSRLTWIRRHHDERTGQYILSIDGNPGTLISASVPQPSVFTGTGAHQQHAYTATLLPIFPAALQNHTQGVGNESQRAYEVSQCSRVAPIWAATQISQTQVTTIGREPSTDLCINDPTVSRRHAQIACIRHRYVLRDLGSKNGTFVNNTRLNPDSVCFLSPNDHIRFGKGLTYIFQVHPTDFTS